MCVALNSDTVNWRMFVWCTPTLRRDGSSFTWRSFQVFVLFFVVVVVVVV